jgi:hypothetical protein
MQSSSECDMRPRRASMTYASGRSRARPRERAPRSVDESEEPKYRDSGRAESRRLSPAMRWRRRRVRMRASR